MTDNISSSAISARESSRTSSGQFGTQPRAEADLELVPDTHYSHEHVLATRYKAAFEASSRGAETPDERAATVAFLFQAADQRNRARMAQAFPGLRMAADDFNEPQVYGPATVDENEVDPPQWAAFRRGEGGYPAGSFSTNLMDFYDSETTTDEDRQAISRWWPHLAAAVDEDS